ncbi:MAG: carboxypeptidase-like regulatory domain-containing protein, partial [Segetibacter sp.]
MVFYTIPVNGRRFVNGLFSKQFITALLNQQIMRVGIISFVLLLLTIQLLSASPVKSQPITQVEVRLKLRNESLLKAFQKIEAQTAFYFMYRENDIKNIKNLQLSASKKTVAEFLDILLANTPLNYRQIENRILITKTDQTDNQLSAVTSESPNRNYLVTGAIKGNVKDNKGGNIQGVTVLLEGATSQTKATDAAGNYSFTKLPAGNYTLSLSFIGYAKISRQLALADGEEKTVDVGLSEEISSLSEVVVVGYGTKKRSDITGSVASVPKERLQNLPVTNVLQAVEGSVAGLNITTNSTAPGSSVDVLVRGQNSISAGTGPLIVVDGIPIS